MELKLATFNLKNDYFSPLKTHWGRRKSAIGEFFLQESPDITGTQELNYNRIYELLEMLPDYDYIGEGRAGEIKGEYCAILYKKKMFQCLKSGTFWLSKNPNSKSRGWLALFPRICTWAVFQNKEGKKIGVLNTHLDVFSPYARADGLIQIAKFVKQNFADMPVALMGDFNAKPDSRALKFIQASHEDTGIFTGSSYSVFYSTQSPDGRTYHGFRGKVTGLPIDYIFTSKQIKIEDAYVVQKQFLGKYPSDHFPIIMKCSLLS